MEQKSATGVHILVVDDDPLITTTLTRFLEKQGHTCQIASSVAEAERLLQSSGFALALCDVNMPDESGLQLARRIIAEHWDTAVVMVTGIDDPVFAETALRLGAYGYMTKPFTWNELLINVANALRRRALEIENRHHRDGLEQLVRQRTDALHARAAQQHAAADLGQRALYGVEINNLFALALKTIRDQLGSPLTTVLELTPDRGHLTVIAADGWEAESLGRRVPMTRAWDAALAVSIEEPVVLDSETRRDCHPAPIGEASRFVTSSLCVVIRLGDGPYGALVIHSTEPCHYSADDVSFAQSVANVLGNALARMRMEERLLHQALHDPLTGLPNRAVLTDRLGYALEMAHRRHSTLALLFIDLDHFKTVNDSLGHRTGDQLLVQVAQRLRLAIRSCDTIARFGGDEFIVLCDYVEQIEDVAELSRRLSDALSEPFVLGDDTVFVTASTGIAIANSDHATAESLLRDADAAMYLAKEHGRGRWEFFDSALRQRAVERIRTETSLRWALDRNEMVVHFQPIIDLTAGRIVALEALARWQHPDRGLVLPDEFVPLCEETGLIVPIGARLLTMACTQLGEWQRQGIASAALTINVNVAARQLSSPHFVDVVGKALDDADIGPTQLALEITESSIVEPGGGVTDTIERLRRLGVRLVLDDFGSGYSSLSYIRRFPLDSIKLDRSFVFDLADNPTQQALVSGIISIAGALGLHTVVEGIERPDQAEVARRIGCEFGQGYVFADPAEAGVIEQLLRAGSVDWSPDRTVVLDKPGSLGVGTPTSRA